MLGASAEPCLAPMRPLCRSLWLVVSFRMCQEDWDQTPLPFFAFLQRKFPLNSTTKTGARRVWPLGLRPNDDFPLDFPETMEKAP